MKSLLFSLLTIVAGVGGMVLGSRWQSVSVPTRNIEFVAPDGVTYAGDLNRTWGGDYVVTAADGTQHTFKDFRAIIIRNVPNRLRPSVFVSAWRVLMAPIACILVCLALSALWFYPPGARNVEA